MKLFIIIVVLMFGSFAYFSKLAEDTKQLILDPIYMAQFGVSDSRFIETAKTSNKALSSFSINDNFVPPIKIAENNLDNFLPKLKSALISSPHYTRVESNGDYIHTQYRSFFFGFIDDIEFYLDKQTHLLHFRLQSRLYERWFFDNKYKYHKIVTTIIPKLIEH